MGYRRPSAKGNTLHSRIPSRLLKKTLPTSLPSPPKNPLPMLTASWFFETLSTLLEWVMSPEPAHFSTILGGYSVLHSGCGAAFSVCPTPKSGTARKVGGANSVPLYFPFPSYAKVGPKGSTSYFPESIESLLVPPAPKMLLPPEAGVSKLLLLL